VLTHIPQLDCPILAAAKQLIGVAGEANGHNWFFMSLEAVDYLGFIEDPNHAVFKGSN